jgi:hypothetical protein
MYWFAQDMGAPGRTPLLSRVVEERMTSDPQLVEGLLRVLNHEVPPSRLLGVRGTASVLADAFRGGRGQRRSVLGEVRTFSGDQLRRRRRPALA